MISRQALRHLALDEVWWLVSPQNPLKDAAGMAPLEDRLSTARGVARDRRVRITDIETRLGTQFTVDTLAELCQRFRSTQFVWLMGADNMAQVTRWARWQDIFHLTPVAVFGRPTYSLQAMFSKAALCFARSRLPAYRAPELAGMRPPAWTFIHYRHDSISATAIRAAKEAT